nr:reverse transcriptase domain-containing protein [Tanacetum cinerariifolium]
MTINPKLPSQILEAQTEGIKEENIKAENLRGMDKSFEIHPDGTHCIKNRCCLPLFGNLRDLIMHESHKSKYSIHPGSDKMYQDLKKLYWWPNMKEIIAEYVNICLTCSKVKAECKKPSGLLDALGTQLDMSTAYHPETDGKSERTIQTLKDMLRACVIDFGRGRGVIKVDTRIAKMLRGLDQLMERKEDGGIYFIWVPLIGDVRTLIMNEAHALRYLVHSGADKTYYDLRDMYGGQVLRRILLTRLLRSSSGSDTNWVIVDRLTKSAHFLAIREDYKMKRLARLYIDEIVAGHEVPTSIISDLDGRFTSRFLENITESLRDAFGYECGSSSLDGWTPMPLKWTSTSAAPVMTQAAIRQLVVDSIITALEAQAANMENANNTNRNLEPREAPVARKCSYKEFMSCQPFNFKDSEKMIEAFIRGLPQSIEGNVTASKPKTLKEAINIAQRLMDQVTKYTLVQVSSDHNQKFYDRRTFNNNYRNTTNNRYSNHNHNRTKDRKLSGLMLPPQLRTMGLHPDLVKPTLKIDIMSIKLGSFDVVVGMDWLSKYHAKIIYDEKVVHIPIDGETLIIREDKRLENIPVVKEFLDVLPKDLPSLPQVRQVEFQIDLILGAAPVARGPYRLAPSEMQKLMDQLQELADRGYHQLRVKDEDILKNAFRTRNLIDSQGLHVGHAKIKAVKNWASPTTPKEIRQFLGLVDHYQKFIKNFSKIAKSLTELTQKNKKYIWGKDQETAFQLLKRKIFEALILALPEGNDDFVVLL